MSVVLFVFPRRNLLAEYPAYRFLAEIPVDYLVLADPEDSSLERFSVEVVPTLFLIDREGRICTSHVGFNAGHPELIKDEVSALPRADANGL